MKIDPGYCPVCGNPICGTINFVCSKECIYGTSDRGRGFDCLQLITNYESCKCELIDIMRAFHIPGCNPTSPEGFHEQIKQFLQNNRRLPIEFDLPNDLFEI